MRTDEKLRKLGYKGVSAARFLRMTTSSVNRMLRQEEMEVI